MVTIIQLPPQPNPKLISAYHRPENLEEHLTAFLATNNAQGFEPLSDGTVAPLADLLWDIGQKFGLYKSSLSDYARMVRRVTRGRIRYQMAIELISRLYGYFTYYDALRMMEPDGMIKNLRYGTLEPFEVFKPLDKSALVGSGPGNERKMPHEEERAGYKASDLPELLHDFIMQYRFGGRRVDEKVVGNYALTRLFGLRSYDRLRKYSADGIIPPGFNPENIEGRENLLATLLKTPAFARGRTVHQVITDLKDCCRNDKVYNELQRAMVFMVEGNLNTPVQYWTRRFGVCGVRVMPRGTFSDANNPDAAIAFLIKGEKISRILIQQRHKPRNSAVEKNLNHSRSKS
jgi:hypothetical protein